MLSQRGLASLQQLIELLNGFQIEINSFPDVLKRFVFGVPFAYAARQGRDYGCIATFFARF